MARILVVDDEGYIRLIYFEELSEEGHEISAVASGHEFVRRMDRLPPEVVVLDIKLVDYDGLELP